MNKLYLVIGILCLIVVASIYLLLAPTKNKEPFQPPPVIQFQPSSPTPSSTIETGNPPAKDRMELQLEADKKLAQEREDFIKKYPWYFNMPLKGQYYFVVFNARTETFIADLYPQKSFSTSLEEQAESLKKVVTEKITALGADTKQYKIEWNIVPE